MHLQIHYDRVGKDGFSRYREITLLFLPDLDNCLPSLDAWRSQWISRREARVEREQEAMLKMEKVCDLCISMRNQFVFFLLMYRMINSPFMPYRKIRVVRGRLRRRMMLKVCF